MNSIRGHKDILFADHHGLEASVLLFQGHRLSEAEALGFIQHASKKVFHSEGRPCAFLSASPQAPNMRRYGGVMIIVHPHYYDRVVARFTDTRGLSRYTAISIKGKNRALVTFISVYLTPAPGGESGQEAAQRRYITRHTGPLAGREPCALAVCDIAKLVAERHRAGSVVGLGGDLQTDITDGSREKSQLLQHHGGGANLVLPTGQLGATPCNPGPQVTRPQRTARGR